MTTSLVIPIYLHPNYPGIHKLHQTRYQVAAGDAIMNRARCSAPRCESMRMMIRYSGLTDLDGEIQTVYCCARDCPRHYPKDYQGRHRA